MDIYPLRANQVIALQKTNLLKRPQTRFKSIVNGIQKTLMKLVHNMENNGHLSRVGVSKCQDSRVAR
jgi:hypothetical protein